MEQIVVPPAPNFPKGFTSFFEALAAGNVRRLGDYYLELNEEGRRGFEAEARSCTEFLAFQDIMNEVYEGVGQESFEVYLSNLYKALYSIWPPAPPEIVNELRRLICTVYTPEEGEPVYILHLQDLPQDIQEKLRQLEIGSNSDHESFVCIQKAFAEGFKASGFAQGLPDKRNAGAGKYRGAFNNAISEYWPAKPRVKTTKTERPKTITEEALAEAERRFYYEAICNLLFHEFTALDPVIGDEACEARPPLLMDAWDTLNSLEKQELDALFCGAAEYRLRHRQDPEVTQIRIISDFAEDKGEALKFVFKCEQLRGCLPFEFLLLCKANTMASELAADEWGVASFDRSKGIYLEEERAKRRSHLSMLSVENIRKMAIDCRKSEDCDGPVFEEVCNVLRDCNVVKIDQGCEIHTLPIYEMMRTVVAYEYVKRRPIILSVYQIECTPKGNDEVQDCAATYNLKRVQTSYYKPVVEKQKFVPTDILSLSEQDRLRPCLTIQAYQMKSSVDVIPVLDGLKFDSLDLDYEAALNACDLSLLIQCYAAIHPVFAGHQIEDPQGFMTGLYEKYCSKETQPWDEEPTRLSKFFNLVKTTCNLGDEYKFLRNLAITCNLQNRQYIKRLLGDEWSALTKKTLCARTLESCGFSINHMNMNNLETVLARDTASLENRELERFHEFDGKKSYTDLSSFK